ncbi:hypothetical protein HDU97_000778 [Phlyctochytrium planicorne]|nr:hypothetical protein HDU97_000778 [Phlyctochytrium planicorne]
MAERGRERKPLEDSSDTVHQRTHEQLLTASSANDMLVIVDHGTSTAGGPASGSTVVKFDDDMNLPYTKDHRQNIRRSSSPMRFPSEHQQPQHKDFAKLRARSSTGNDFTSNSNLDLVSAGNKTQLLTALDSHQDEVANFKKVELFGMPLLKRSKLQSYNAVRQTYKYQRQSQRQDKPKTFLAVSFLSLDIKYYYLLFWRIVKSPSRIAIFMILDLLSDLLMSILYLLELQWNVSARSSDSRLKEVSAPHWLLVARPSTVFYIAVAFSSFNLISFFIRVILADHKLNAFFSWVLFLEIITSVPFIVGLRLDIGRILYVPYFLRAVIAVSRLKTVLRLRGATVLLNFGVVTEKMILVFTTIATVIYVGLCSFQYAESNFQKEGDFLDLTLMDCFYFIIVTLSTVGYGDITAKTTPGQVVVVLLIFAALALVPPMLSTLIETLSLQKAGGGSYKKGSSKFVVILGNFDTPTKIIDVLESFLTDESSDQTLKVVIIARSEAPQSVKFVINQSLYKDRVIYLVGGALEADDMKRFYPEAASAVFIVGDRSAGNERREDEENTLRAWAIDDDRLQSYTNQNAKLFIANLLPETKLYQDRAAEGIICIDDIKQIIMAHTAIFPGSAGLLINLIHKYTPYDRYPNTWAALYGDSISKPSNAYFSKGDGAGNEIYTDFINPVFDRLPFTEVAWYLYHEFQVILLAAMCFDTMKEEYHLLLNPGSSYHFKTEDKYVLIAQGPQELMEIRNLTEVEYRLSLAKDPLAYPHAKEERSQVLKPTLDRYADSFFAAFEDTIIGTPSPNYSDPNVQHCHLLRTKATLDQSIVKNSTAFTNHFIICTRHFNVFQFLCTLRAAYLSPEDIRPVLFLAENLPTDDEFRILSVFPKVYYMIGDPRTEKDLLRAGLFAAHKVVIFSLASSNGDQFSDSSAIMTSHLIYSMIPPTGKRISVVIELEKRAHIRYLQPSAVQSSRKQRRKGNAATRVVDQNLGYLYTPMFAAGRVVVAAMLDCLLFQLFEGDDNPVVDTVRLMTGVHLRKDVHIYQRFGLRSSNLKQIPVPADFIGVRFSDLFKELALKQGAIPIALYRSGQTLTNRLPFVITNPLPSLLLEPEDLVFVIG